MKGCEMDVRRTPGPWSVEWYECRADRNDVEAGIAKNIGDTLWRVPKSIGPLSSDENHWAGMYLEVEEGDARLIAAAPDLLEALRDLELGANTVAACYDRNPGNFAAALADLKRYADAARAAIAKATGEMK